MAEYDSYAAQFSDERAGASLNRLVEEPVVREFTGDPSGLRVLDAGCGDGSYARWLAERGATVTAIDASFELLSIAKERHSDLPITFLSHDLNDPIPFADASFDLVLSTLVTEYIENVENLFSEFSRILDVKGRLIVSCDHPFLSGVIKNDQGERVLVDYFSRTRRSYLWFGREIPVFSHTLEDYLAAILKAGFSIDRIREPRPIEQARKENPALWERANRIPTILVICASVSL